MKTWFITKKSAVKSLMAVICVLSLVATGLTGCGSSQPDEANTVSSKTGGDENSLGNETQQAQTNVQEEEAYKLPDFDVEEEKPVTVDTDEDWPIEYLLANMGDGSGVYSGGSNYPSRDGFEVYAFTPENVRCSYDKVNGFSIKISDTGSEDWHIQLKKNNVKLENGKWYQVTFDAKSSIDRNIVFSMQRDGSKDEDWRSYSGTKTVQLGNEWKPYTIIFRMTDDTDEKAIYNLALGTVGGNRIRQQHTVNIKNMNLEELEDTWLDRVSQNGNLLKNPKFEYGDIAWEASVVEPGAATVKFENGKAVFDISNVGTTDWHVQLKQDSIPLEHGYNYRLTFKASSTASRSINIGFMDNKFVHWYGGSLEALNAGAERTVAVEFYMDKATNNDACMFISMGKIDNMNTPPSVITLSDFTLEKLPGRPTSSSSSSGGGEWSAPIVNFGDGWELSYWFGSVGQCDKSSNTYHIEILDTGSLDWHVQMQKKGIVLEKGKTYRMSFEARSSIGRKIVCALQKDGTNDDIWTSYSGGSGQYELNDSWQTFTREFTMSDETDRNVIYNISLGAVDRKITNAHDVYFRNIILEEVPDKPIESVPVGQEMLTGEWVINNQIPGNTITENNGSFTASIGNVGVNDYDVQIIQKDLTLEQGCTYEFKCNADFDNGQRIIKVGIMQDGTYEWYGGEDLTIGTAPQTRADSGQWMKFAGVTGKEYTFTFTYPADKPTIKNGILAISMGKIAGVETPTGTVSISGLSLKKISEKTDKPDTPNPDDSGLNLIADSADNMLKGKKLELNVGGSASAKLNGTKITINKVGTEDYDVQLKLTDDSPKLALEKGATYVFKADASFDAGKDETDKTRKITVGFMSNDGKYDWYGGDTVDIGSESSPINIEFTMNKETDENTLFVISMGQMKTEDKTLINTPTGTVSLSNISLVKKEADKPGEPDEPIINPIPVGQEMLTGEWVINNQIPGNTITENNGSFTASIGNVGVNDYDVQIIQKDLTLEQGCTYEFKCNADFDNGQRIIKVGIMQDGTYKWYGGEDITIGTSTRERASSGKFMKFAGVDGNEYTFTFTVDKPTINDGMLAISMGKIEGVETPTGTVTLSNLSLKKIPEKTDEPDTPNPDDSGLKLIADVDGNLLKGKSFDIDETAGAVRSVSPDKTKITITNVGTEDYGVKLHLAESSKLALKAGCTYEFTADVKFEAAEGEKKQTRIIKVGFMDQGYNNWYGGTDKEITNESDKIKASIALKADDDEVNFFISMGKIANEETPKGTITLSNISLVEADKPDEPDEPIVNPVPVGQEMLTGEWVLNKGAAGNSITEANGNITAKIVDVGVNDYDVQVSQKGLTLEQGCTYEFKCNADFDNGQRIIKVGIMEPTDIEYIWYGGSDLTIGTAPQARANSGQWMKFAGVDGNEYTFTFTVDKPTINDGMLAISMGKIKDVETPTGTVTLSNLSLKKIPEKTDEPDVPKPEIPAAPTNLLADVDGNMLDFSKLKLDNIGVQGASATSNAAKTQFEISNLGDESWKVSIEQPLTLVEGHEYRFSGKVYSSTARKIEVLIQSVTNWDRYAEADASFASGETKEIERVFTYNYSGTKENKVRFFVGMGKVAESDKAGTIQLSDFSLVDITEKEDPKPVDPNPPVEGNKLPELAEGKGWSLANGSDKAKLTYENGTAKIVISNVGAAAHEVQFSHALELEEGAEYEVSCDVESSVDRSITICVQQNEAPWDEYKSDTKLLTANDKKTITFEFTKKDDIAAAFAVNMGKADSGDTPTGTITLSNISVVKIKDAPKPVDPNPPVEGNILPELAEGNEWNLANGSDKATLTYENGTAKIDIHDVGDAAYKVQFSHALELTEGAEYKVSCDVESSVDRSITICVQQNEAPWDEYKSDTKLLTANDKKTITFEFTKKDDIAAAFAVNMGKANSGDTPTGTITLSNISIVMTEDAPGTDDSELKLIADGDDNKLKGITPGKSGSFDFDGTTATISNVGSEPWDVQLQLSGLDLKTGETYTGSFTIMSSVDRKVTVGVQKPSGTPQYGAKYEQDLTAGSEPQTFTFEVNEDNGAYDEPMFYISMGSFGTNDPTSEHTITISNLSLVKKSDAAASAASVDEESDTSSSDAEIETFSLKSVADEEVTDEVVKDDESETDEEIKVTVDEKPETVEVIKEDADEEPETDEVIQDTTDKEPDPDEETPEDEDTSLNEDGNDSDDNN